MTGTLLIVITQLATAQDLTRSFWSDVPESSISSGQAARAIIPASYRTMSLDVESIKNYLGTVPMEYSADAASRSSLLSIPMPDGTFQEFTVVESPIMEEGLASRYPDIKTYLGQGIKDRTATVRFDLTPLGFHAMILSVDGSVFIDPYSLGDISNYIVYYKRDFVPLPGDVFVEEWDGDVPSQQTLKSPEPGIGEMPPYMLSHGSQLRTYRLALAADFEYVDYFGSKANAIAAMVTTMNRVNEVYEVEVAVRMVIIAGNDDLVYDVEADDPYPELGACDLRSHNQTNIDDVIGNDNYDIGHLFAIGSGGCAAFNAVCTASIKAYGVTGRPDPVGDPFDIDYVSHEIGHQFGGSHTWNGNSGSCTAGQYTSTAAYEPGSATTIMGYAGICGADDLQPNSDPYFHTYSFDQIVGYITAGGNCATNTATGNTPPNVDAGPSGYVLPISTPFQLTGSGSDPDGDAVTFCWEEFDLGPQGDPGSPSGNAPIFRSFNPVTTPTRTFPKLSDLLNNTQTIGEILPTYSRDLTFRLTVRDNKAGGGGVNYDVMAMTVSDAAGPFLVTSPNTSGVTWCEGESVTVTWNVAGTDAAPVSCAQVNILLSLDGGYSYPITLASNTPNDGSQAITLPFGNTTTAARVKIESVGNVFFDISNFNFTIKSPPVVTDQPDDLSVDWGESATFTVNASGSPATVQWQYSDNGGVSFSNMTGETSKTLYLPCVIYDNNGNQYRAVFTNDCDVVYTDAATLTVSPPITSQPVDVSAEFGDNVSFTVGYNGSPDIQWSVSTDGGGSWTPMPGETGSTLGFTCVTLDMDGNIYRATLSTDCETVYSDEVTLTVAPKLIATSVTVTPNPQQYSDLVDIEVTLTPGLVCGESPATGAQIYIGSQFMGEVTFTLVGDDLKGYLDDVALLEPTPFGTAPTGQMAPGDHTVTAYLLGVNSNFNVTDPTTTLTIQPEDATAYYTGALYASTQGINSNSAIVTLSATIKDITAVFPVADPNAGDIRNATLTFVNRDNGDLIAENVPIGLVDPSDPTVAVGTYNWNVDISGDAEDFTIGIIVGGYYVRNNSADNVVVTVAKPLPNFVTGGGYIILSDPEGSVAGDVGSKNNFGFSVKFNKKGTNLKGRVNSIIRRTESDGVHTYQIKGNKITSLAVVSPDDEGGEATINCKASIQDITDPLNPISVEGNASMQIDMNDEGEPGDADLIAVTIWDKWGGLWFSSNWDGTYTLQQLLDGGNLAVRSDESFKSVMGEEILAESGNALRIFPNPNKGNFTLMFEPEILPESLVMVVDMMGQVMEKFELNTNELHMNIRGSGKGIYQVIIFNGTTVYKAKLVVN